MENHSADLVSRRQLLGALAATAGVGGLAGCLSLDQPGASDVQVYNAAAETETVSITITADDAETAHTSRTLDVAPREEIQAVNQGKVPLTRNYAIDVSVENGPSETFQWEEPTVERAPLLVFIDGSPNIRFLLQAG